MILVAGVVDRGHLALAEGVIECVVDLAHRDAEPRGRGPVDGDVGLQPLVLLVAIDLRQLWNRLQLREDLGRPIEQLVRVAVLQRVLILGVGGAATDTDVLHRLQKQRGPRNLGHLAAQPADRVSIWLTIRPPTMAIPSGCRNSPPSPMPMASGRAPNSAAAVVIMMGRKRKRQAW
jgi:hypothetical protein